MSAFLLNPWTVGIGLALLGVLGRRAWRWFVGRRKPQKPRITVSYEDVRGWSSSTADKPKHILCKWPGVLRLENVSPFDAFRVAVEVPEVVRLTSPVPHTLRRIDGPRSIQTEVQQTFDKHRIFPRTYAKSPLDDVADDLDPERDCYPTELLNLTITVRCENEAGQCFECSFRRTDAHSKELTAEPESGHVCK